MQATIDEVRSLILMEFPGSDVSNVKEENQRVYGIIDWNGFRNMDVSARNRLVTQKVRNKLGPKGYNVGFLLPHVPGEKL